MNHVRIGICFVLCSFVLTVFYLAQPFRDLPMQGENSVSTFVSGAFAAASSRGPFFRRIVTGGESGERALTTEGEEFRRKTVPTVNPEDLPPSSATSQKPYKTVPPPPPVPLPNAPQPKHEGLRLAFTDFWPNFNQDNNFFTNALRTAFNVTICTPPDDDVDLLIFSKFGEEHFNVSSKRRVFFTGENLRPDLDLADLSLSFDRLEPRDPRQMRFPLWIMYIDWFGKDSEPDVVSPDVLSREGRTFGPEQRDGITMINSNPSGFRTELWPAIVEKLGDRAVSMGGFMTTPGYEVATDKVRAIGRMKLHLAIENSVFPGYTTEKILHAYAGSAVPVYHGDPTVSLDFNPKSFLDLSGMTVGEAVHAIEELLADEKRMDGMLAERPMKERFDIAPFVKAICDVAREAKSAGATLR